MASTKVVLTLAGRRYPFDFEKLTNVELIAMQKVTGMRLSEWKIAISETDVLALTGLVWLVQKREQPDLKFSEVVFAIGDIDLDEDDDEAEVVDPADPKAQSAGNARP